MRGRRTPAADEVVETELKLLVPGAARRAVEREFAAAGSALRLQATYFDTADHRLAAAGLALRLRKEGRRCVQALKGSGGDGALQRFEHEVALDAGAPAVVDSTRHAGTAVGDRLAALLDDGAPLEETFRTDIRRRVRAARTRSGQVELALDIGHLVAGERRLPVAELEVELQRGSPQAVLDVARRWVLRHGLVVESASKAERGDRLARGEAAAAPPRKAAPPRLDPLPADEPALFAAIVSAALEQALANAGPVAAGACIAEHLHQLRVGLRRLRTALRLFDELMPPGLDERVAALFRRLGAARDRDALEESVLPQLRAAGAPLLQLPEGDETTGDTPAQVLCERDTSLLWLDLIALAQPPAAPPADPVPDSLPALYGAKLDRLHRRVGRDARRFAELDDVARHALRKRVKRLRYAVEFSAPLYKNKAVERYLARLRPAQEALGVLNDLQLARALFDRLKDDEPRAWFALGWLASQREAVLDECRGKLRRLRRAKTFW